MNRTHAALLMLMLVGVALSARAHEPVEEPCPVCPVCPLPTVVVPPGSEAIAKALEAIRLSEEADAAEIDAE
jgi:hypothetical protein